MDRLERSVLEKAFRDEMLPEATPAVRYCVGGRLQGSETRTGGGVDTRYITNEKGERVSVILDIKEYERLLAALEDLEDLRAADQALCEIELGEDELVPWEKVRDKKSDRSTESPRILELPRSCREPSGEVSERAHAAGGCRTESRGHR